MKVFVKGSTRLLGTNLVQALLEAGHSVKALARTATRLEMARGLHSLALISQRDQP